MSYEAERTQRRLDAAARLEELATVAKAIAEDLRANPDESAGRDAWLRSNDTAYGRVYWLRTQLGRIVATLGTGLPSRWIQRAVAEEYDEKSK